MTFVDAAHLPKPEPEALEALLIKHNSPYSYASLRALIMGSILAPDMVRPSDIVSEVMPEPEDDDTEEDAVVPFNDKAEAMSFFTSVMGLWNELHLHQDADRPFCFTPIPAEPDAEEFVSAMILRNGEFDAFLKGLAMGDYQMNDIDERFYSSEKDGEPWAEFSEESLAFLDLPQTIMIAGGTTGDAMDALTESVQQNEKTVPPEFDPPLIWNAIKLADRAMKTKFGEFLTGTKRERLIRIAAMTATAEDDDWCDEPLVREEPKIGRNDPCHCGSGKKFKKCCLQ